MATPVTAAWVPGALERPSGGNYKVVELWESPGSPRREYRAWIDGTIKPNLPPGARIADPEFIDLVLAVAPGRRQLALACRPSLPHLKD